MLLELLWPRFLAGNEMCRTSRLTMPNLCACRIDRIVALTSETRESTLNALKQETINAAVQAGALRDTVWLNSRIVRNIRDCLLLCDTQVQVVELEDVPISYLPGGFTRISIKAIGDLDFKSLVSLSVSSSILPSLKPQAPGKALEKDVKSEKTKKATSKSDEPEFDESGAWVINERDLDYIALGAGILGSGRHRAAGRGFVSPRLNIYVV